MARRRGNGRGRPVVRERVSWDAGLFSSIIDEDGIVATNFILFDPQDVRDTLDPARIKVRRVICQGVVAVLPSSVAYTVASTALMVVVYVLDREDTDTLLNTTGGGSILRTARVLATRLVPVAVQEGVAAQANPGIVVSPTWDIDWKGQAWVTNDEVVYCGVQLLGGLSTAVPVNGVGVDIHSRVLWVVP